MTPIAVCSITALSTPSRQETAAAINKKSAPGRLQPPREICLKARILVVDDNLLNRKLALHLLEMEGYEVLQCADAEEVLELLAHDAPPDLILMDIALPGMDGLTLTSQLRTEPRFADVPIVAMTAFAMRGDEERARRAGCEGYITKPIDTRRLPQQVEEFLQRRPKPDAPWSQ